MRPPRSQNDPLLSLVGELAMNYLLRTLRNKGFRATDFDSSHHCHRNVENVVEVAVVGFRLVDGDVVFLPTVTGGQQEPACLDDVFVLVDVGEWCPADTTRMRVSPRHQHNRIHELPAK